MDRPIPGPSHDVGTILAFGRPIEDRSQSARRMTLGLALCASVSSAVLISLLAVAKWAACAFFTGCARMSPELSRHIHVATKVQPCCLHPDQRLPRECRWFMNTHGVIGLNELVAIANGFAHPMNRGFQARIVGLAFESH